MDYKPNPINTDAIFLPPDLLHLRERLAENTHDLWSRQRLGDGWRWGPRRDDSRKEHPSLIPYADLSEEEKEYDRVITLETLKSIIALGYRIVPAEDAS